MKGQIYTTKLGSGFIAGWIVDFLQGGHPGSIDVQAWWINQGQYTEINKPYAMKTDIKSPAKIITTPDNTHCLVDGNHRVFKAMLKEIAEFPVIVYNLEESQAARISDGAALKIHNGESVEVRFKDELHKGETMERSTRLRKASEVRRVLLNRYKRRQRREGGNKKERR